MPKTYDYRLTRPRMPHRIPLMIAANNDMGEWDYKVKIQWFYSKQSSL
jgi:hypothetical protein